MNVSQFKTTRVALDSDMSTVAPLELQHLGLGEEYKRMVVQTVKDIREAKRKGVCIFLVSLLVVGCIVGIVMGAVASSPPHPGLMVGVMFGSFALLVVGMCLSMRQGRQALQKAIARCEAVNRSPNMVGRAQFSIDSESYSSRDHDGKTHTHTTHFLKVEYSLACPEPAMQPVAVPMGLPAPGYPYPHGPTPTAPSAGYNLPMHSGAGPAFSRQPVENVV